jgi:hypothetical protein
MTHIPGPLDVVMLVFWIVAGAWILRATMCWLTRSKQIEQRQRELEALVRALAVGMNVALPESVARATLRSRLVALCGRSHVCLLARRIVARRDRTG